MSLKKARPELGEQVTGPPKAQEQPRRLYRVQSEFGPRLLIEAESQVGAAELYRQRLGIRRLDLPVETIHVEA